MLALAVISTLVTILALYYAWRQTQLADRLAKKQEEQQREIYDWQVRHERVARIISKRPPHAMYAAPGGLRCLYPAVFSAPDLRNDIERYVVEYANNNRSLFVPRTPDELQLRSPSLRETVEKAERALQECKKNDPELYAHYF